MRILIYSLILWFGLNASAAHAQFGDVGGLGGILEDILGQPPQAPENALIDDIPFIIETDETLDLTGMSLVVAAYAPAEPSGAFSKPDKLAQTEMLLTGLELPLTLDLAVPAPVTDTIEYSRLEAKIIDGNGNTKWTAQEDGIYRGVDLVRLKMVKPSTSDSRSSPRVGLETIYGKAQLSERSDIFMGSNLNVQLIESGLAGGLTTAIAAENQVSLDNKTSPYAFSLDRHVFAQDRNKSYTLKAWITDWAGRKTHVMERPVPYNGPDRAYTLKLDTYILSPAPLRDMQAASPKAVVKGLAQFDAYKGLPRGSRLTATLIRSIGAPGMASTLATKSLPLDGLSGDVSFDITASQSDFDPMVPAPMLEVRITNAEGQAYFSAVTIASLEDTNIVRLTPSASY